MLPDNIIPQQLSLFAGLLAAPGQDSLAIVEELAQTNPWLQDIPEELAQWGLPRWQGEHTRLFINGHPKTVCPPFESSYVHGQQNGKACSDVLALYYQIGLQPVEGVFPDYLGTLLECAAYLAEQQPVDMTSWDILWQKHLARWVPRFARDLETHSRLRLYQQLGKQLQALFPNV